MLVIMAPKFEEVSLFSHEKTINFLRKCPESPHFGALPTDCNVNTIDEVTAKRALLKVASNSRMRFLETIEESKQENIGVDVNIMGDSHRVILVEQRAGK